MLLSRVLSPVLVGRDSELSTLEDSLLSALRGDGGVVIVGGEAGMGKTRLVNALAARARTLGCMVLAGGCSRDVPTVAAGPDTPSGSEKVTRTS